jgi:ATP-dependent helicase Lhr and Lhr-like helicase
VQEEYGERVDGGCTMVLTRDRRTRWWTWAGGRANAILVAALEAIGDLRNSAPFVTERALEALKFADLLPPDLARRTLEARLADPTGALSVLRRPVASAM